MDVMDIIRVRLSFQERITYYLSRVGVDEQDAVLRANWVEEDRTRFQREFQMFRKTCFHPTNVQIHDQFIQNLFRLRDLYEAKRVEEWCLICFSSAHLDSIALCGHVFCGRCFRSWFEYRRSIQEERQEVIPRPPDCPCCRRVIREPEVELIFPSTKMKTVISMSRKILRIPRPFSKIVILSSSPGALLWFNEAFSGLNIPATLILEFEANVTPAELDTFLQSVEVHVLLILIAAVQVDVRLPPCSSVLVAEGIVADVRSYLLHRLVSFPVPNCLTRKMFVAEQTVEETIAAQPLFDDFFNSFDENNTFIGPTFTNTERLVEILEGADAFGYNLDDDDDEGDDEEEG